MKNSKRETGETIEQTNKENIRLLRKKERYLRIFETDIIKLAEMKIKMRYEYLKGRRKLLKTRSRNLIKERQFAC